MKTIGLIGGITWYSTIDYYRLLNEEVNKRLGGVHSAHIILNSVDFADMKRLTALRDWRAISVIMCDAAKSIEAAGAQCLVICANTMHNVADSIEAAITIPVLHIADAVGTAIKEKNLKKVALLGTKYTMQMDFYAERLNRQGIRVIIPGEADIEYINDAIYEEFGKGIFLPERKKEFLRIIDDLIKEGAEGVVLGCTEIPILIKQDDCNIPVFDTSTIHALAAVDYALSEM